MLRRCDQPTVDALTEYLAGLLIREPAVREAPPAVNPVQQVEDLSDEEVERLFAEKIAANGPIAVQAIRRVSSRVLELDVQSRREVGLANKMLIFLHGI